MNFALFIAITLPAFSLQLPVEPAKEFGLQTHITPLLQHSPWKLYTTSAEEALLVKFSYDAQHEWGTIRKNSGDWYCPPDRADEVRVEIETADGRRWRARWEPVLKN